MEKGVGVATREQHNHHPQYQKRQSAKMRYMRGGNSMGSSRNFEFNQDGLKQTRSDPSMLIL